MRGTSAAARSGKTDALRITSFDVLLPAKGMERIEEEVAARLPLHPLWVEPKPELCLTIMAVHQLPKAERFSRAGQWSIMRIADFHVIPIGCEDPRDRLERFSRASSARSRPVKDRTQAASPRP
jgi:hypothetical protein